MLFEDFCRVVGPFTLSYRLKARPLGREVKAPYPGEWGKMGKPPPAILAVIHCFSFSGIKINRFSHPVLLTAHVFFGDGRLNFIPSPRGRSL